MSIDTCSAFLPDASPLAAMAKKFRAYPGSELPEGFLIFLLARKRSTMIAFSWSLDSAMRPPGDFAVSIPCVTYETRSTHGRA